MESAKFDVLPLKKVEVHLQAMHCVGISIEYQYINQRQTFDWYFDIRCYSTQYTSASFCAEFLPMRVSLIDLQTTQHVRIK